jgi:xanthine dehydrogenase accessory factor
VVCQEPEDVARELALTPQDFVCVVTHDHALDHRLVQELLKRPLRFLGMIGSLPKQRKFALRLRARGFRDEEIARLHTPLGLSIGAVTPEEIAVSVLAQLVAVRRGVAVEPGWVPPAGAGRAVAAEESGESEDRGEPGGGGEATPAPEETPTEVERS